MTSRLRLQVGFLAAGAATVLLGAASYQGLSLYRNSVSWVSHTRSVLIEAERVLSNAEAAELTAGIGPSSLDAYLEARAATIDALELLREMTSNNPPQQERVADLRARIEAGFSQMDGAVRHQPLREQPDVVPLHQEIRPMVSRIENEEESLLVTRRDTSHRTAVNLVALTIGGFLVLLAFVGGAALLARSALRDEERVNEFQARLVAIVAHDIRSPLAALRLSAQSLRRSSDLSDREATLVDRIDHSAGRIEEVADLIVDYTRARVGSGLALRREPTDLARLVEVASDELRTRHPERAVTVQVDGSPRGWWDPARLQQLLANLLENAHQYGTPGTAIQVSVRGGDPAELRVLNHGAPIDPRRRATLFEPFHRGVSSGSRNLGLGLFIVGQIVRAHGGTLDVFSTEGRTSFVARIPTSTGQ